MTETELVKWILMAALSGVVWFMKRTIDQQDAAIKTLQTEQTRIKEEYLHKSDFKEFKNELRGMFEEIKQDIRTLRTNNV